MKNKILLALSVAFITGCSMMPYHDTFMCQGGRNIHICERVSDVLQQSDNGTLPKYSCNGKVVKAVNAKPIKVTHIYYSDNCDCKELKNMIEAVSYENLKKPEEIVIIKEKSNHNANNTANKKIPLNRYIKVCVYNANIRQKPSCQSRIVKIVRKGTKLYAYYIQGAWIKVKGGFIHKSLVCGGCK